MDENNSSKQSILVNDGGSLTIVGIEQIKNSYICEGASAEELALKYHMDIASIQQIIEDNKLDALRTAFIKNGLEKLQNIQLAQAEKLMNLDNSFKRMRIIQLEKMMEDYLAYYAAHGHFYKVHPISGEILKDTNGIAMQIKIPNVSHEITQLKESFTLSEGLKQALGHIEDLINKPKDVNIPVGDVINADFQNLFSKNKKQDD